MPKNQFYKTESQSNKFTKLLEIIQRLYLSNKKKIKFFLKIFMQLLRGVHLYKSTLKINCIKNF